MNSMKGGSIHFEDLVIFDVLLIFTGLVLIYYGIWVEFQKVINATNMIHVPVCQNSEALCVFFEKNLPYSLDPGRTSFASVDEDSTGMKR
jgi:uncharacterized membrane protein